MSAEEESKAVMSRFTNEFDNPGKLEVADEIIAPECPLYFGSTLMGTGPEAFKQARAMMYGAFPDLLLTIEEMIAQGDALAQRYTGRGTHKGEFTGIAPTGKWVEFEGISAVRVREGRIVEYRGMPDMLGLLQQIGVVPALGQAAEEASPT